MRILLLILVIAPMAKALVQEPSRCLASKSSPCLIKTQKKPQTVRWQGAHLWLSKETVVSFEGPEIRLLQGDVWLQSEVETPFVTAFVNGTFKGDLWLRQSPQRTHVRRMAGDLFLRLRATGKTDLMPVGFENWYAGLQSDRTVYQGVLRPMPATEVLAEWVRDFKVPIQLSKGLWSRWSHEWQGNVEQASEIYQASMNRYLASVADQNLRQKKLKIRQSNEAERLRQHFRSRNGLDAFTRPSQGPNSSEF